MFCKNATIKRGELEHMASYSFHQAFCVKINIDVKLPSYMDLTTDINNANTSRQYIGYT